MHCKSLVGRKTFFTVDPRFTFNETHRVFFLSLVLCTTIIDCIVLGHVWSRVNPMRLAFSPFPRTLKRFPIRKNNEKYKENEEHKEEL